MTNEIEEEEEEETAAATAGSVSEIKPSSSSSWCAKLFVYVKNRNRIGPGKIELADCDFFIVGPRRTLRVLIPVPRGSVYYEKIGTTDENFVSRWSDAFGTSLREPETKSVIDVEKNKKSESSLNPVDLVIIQNQSEMSHDESFTFDGADKNKIVKDLEEYIERLLEEVLSDTVKFFNDAGNTLKKSHEVLRRVGKCSRGSVNSDSEKQENTKKSNVSTTDRPDETIGTDDAIDSLDIGTFPLDENKKIGTDDAIDSFDIGTFALGENKRTEVSKDGGGYVNRGFVGSGNDPDSLDFRLGKSACNEHENLDCTDSGINSVETIEFQTSREPSLEQSLMEIMDAKFGRTSSLRRWKNLDAPDPMDVKKNDMTIDSSLFDDDDDEEMNFSIVENTKTEGENVQIPNNEENRITELENEAGETSNFDKLRLEFLSETKSTSKKIKAVEALREKFAQKFSTTRKNERRENGEKEIYETTKITKTMTTTTTAMSGEKNDNSEDDRAVEFRRIRKPIVVFLHGFGSSAQIFENQLEYFSNLGYPCLAPELLGHGMSSAPDRPSDYHFDKLLKDLETILGHYVFGPGRKCVLVAHNYGCSFAAALARKYDEEVRQLVLISGGGPTPLAPPSTEGTGHRCLRAVLTPLLTCGLRRDVLYSARGRQHPYCGSEPIEQWPSHMKYVLDGMIWPEGDYVFHRRITTPTLLIHGLRDDKVSLVQECQMERTIIKAFLDAIPTAGHSPMIDRPEQINHIIHRFVDSWRRKKR